MNLTSPLTGAAQTGLTSPTFTLSADTAPTIAGKQFAISALGGTQTNVLANTIATPFTISLFKPAKIKAVPANSLLAGIQPNWPKNQNKLITRKSVNCTSIAQSILEIRTEFNIPAGAPVQDLVSIKSAISSHIGALQQDLDQWYEAIESGTL
ncbi:coat protein [ssRNA phage SRR5466725_1]|uniref:Coat protein n=1 Tax=ssRNA phage SRR5466725_1 TaxID=2786407 RepID=A0A8S5L419_9VIRU|nr:coat protein [ssRNA phage SRR5466725_1]DAD52440.1 TPA_asm: coat protein [ssRNA phage SRR5466725_1]